MGCLLVLFAGLFPRMGLFIVWVARPGMVSAAFDTWIWPLLGFIFFPCVTLIYVVLWRTGGLQGFDWFWIALALALDLGHWGIGYTQRRGVPGYPHSQV